MSYDGGSRQQPLRPYHNSAHEVKNGTPPAQHHPHWKLYKADWTSFQNNVMSLLLTVSRIHKDYRISDTANKHIPKKSTTVNKRIFHDIIGEMFQLDFQFGLDAINLDIIGRHLSGEPVVWDASGG